MMGGGKVGMHKMPDGSMMRDDMHKGMKYGGGVQKMAMGGKVRGYGKARGAKSCKMV
jgi:hypothetical protein